MRVCNVSLKKLAFLGVLCNNISLNELLKRFGQFFQMEGKFSSLFVQCDGRIKKDVPCGDSSSKNSLVLIGTVFTELRTISW